MNLARNILGDARNIGQNMGASDSEAAEIARRESELRARSAALWIAHELPVDLHQSARILELVRELLAWRNQQP